MKRLNRKGFTLVELLAVIVILAIVMGITLVTVLPTLKNSRQKAFELTAQTAADYLEKQYQLYLINETTTITFATGQNGLIKTPVSGSTITGVDITDEQYAQAGLKKDNYATGKWYINSTNGRACVQLTPDADGEYYDATGTAESTGC